MIYLDNTATSFPKPDAIIEAVLKCMKEVGARRGRSSHTLARQADKVVFEARETLARLFDDESSERIVFASNASEVLDIAIKGKLSPGHHAIATSL